MASSFLLVSLLLAFFSHCQADLISDVCSKALNPSFCSTTLRSAPRSRGADLKTLGLIAVDKAASASGAAIKVAKSFTSGSNKGKADTCIETITDAVDNLNKCRQLLVSGGGVANGDLQTKASAALTDISTCDDEFGGSEPPQLKKSSKIAQDFVSVVLVVVNRL